MRFNVISNNHPKGGYIHPFSQFLSFELPLNIEIILVLLVVPICGTIGTGVGLYHHRHIEDSLHQLWLQIITMIRHLTPSNIIEGIFSSGNFIIPNKNRRFLLSHMITTA